MLLSELILYHIFKRNDLSSLRKTIYVQIYIGSIYRIKQYTDDSA